jgi:formate hydrogenlyase subunit 3/multisubunit Na+/H+ antiporter MnhD subunit
MATAFMVSILSITGLTMCSLGVSYLLNQHLELPLWISLISVGLFLVLMSAICGAFFYHFATKANQAFSCSRLEAKRNIQWLRDTIIHSNDADE